MIVIAVLVGLFAIFAALFCLDSWEHEWARVWGYVFIVCILLGIYDCSSPVYKSTSEEYVVTKNYEDITFPKEVIFKHTITETSPLRPGAIGAGSHDTTYEFIKFYEEGDLDDYKNIKRISD